MTTTERLNQPDQPTNPKMNPWILRVSLGLLGTAGFAWFLSRNGADPNAMDAANRGIDPEQPDPITHTMDSEELAATNMGATETPLPPTATTLPTETPVPPTATSTATAESTSTATATGAGGGEGVEGFHGDGPPLPDFVEAEATPTATVTVTGQNGETCEYPIEGSRGSSFEGPIQELIDCGAITLDEQNKFTLSGADGGNILYRSFSGRDYEEFPSTQSLSDVYYLGSVSGGEWVICWHELYGIFMTTTTAMKGAYDNVNQTTIVNFSN